MPKMYVKAIGPNSFEFVSNIKDATADDRAAVDKSVMVFHSAEPIKVERPPQIGEKWAIQVERRFPD
jgi:hypothetical protein